MRASRSTRYPLPIMIRMLLLFLMAVAQIQPLAAAVLCEQHHDTSAPSCMGEHADHASPSGQSHHPASVPTDHGCQTMVACTTSAPAFLTPSVAANVAPLEFVVPLLPEHTLPRTVLAAPPFHPPKA